jgi:hypothetical protein
MTAATPQPERAPSRASALQRNLRVVELGTPRPWDDPACDAEPWERLPGEPAGAFDIFVAYRSQLPGHRSLRNAAKDMGKSARRLNTLSSQWHWQERVKLWDRYLDKQRQAVAIQDAQEMVQRHAALSRAILAVVADAVLGNEDKGIEPMDPAKLQPRDVARLVSEAGKLERLSRGEPTETTAVVTMEPTADRAEAGERMRRLLADPELLDAAEKLGAAMVDQDEQAGEAT